MGMKDDVSLPHWFTSRRSREVLCLGSTVFFNIYIEGIASSRSVEGMGWGRMPVCRSRWWRCHRCFYLSAAHGDQSRGEKRNLRCRAIRPALSATTGGTGFILNWISYSFIEYSWKKWFSDHIQCQLTRSIMSQTKEELWAVLSPCILFSLTFKPFQNVCDGYRALTRVLKWMWDSTF